jgi:hypothetical protein
MKETINWTIYGWCMLGITISVLLPVLWEAVYRYFPKTRSVDATRSVDLVAFWRVVVPYVVLGMASALTALVLVILSGDAIPDHRAALLAGYAWDSTLQKFKR